MTKLEIIELIAIVVVGLGLGIFYLVKAIKNHWVKELTYTINEAIAYAEEIAKKNPSFKEKKKEYVLEQVENKCRQLGIPYKVVKKIISKLIDKIIANYNIIAKKGK